MGDDFGANAKQSLIVLDSRRISLIGAQILKIADVGAHKREIIPGQTKGILKLATASQNGGPRAGQFYGSRSVATAAAKRINIIPEDSDDGVVSRAMNRPVVN